VHMCASVHVCVCTSVPACVYMRVYTCGFGYVYVYVCVKHLQAESRPSRSNHRDPTSFCPNHTQVSRQMLQCVAVSCNVLQCVIICCSVSYFVAVSCGLLQCQSTRRDSTSFCPNYTSVCRQLLQCVAACCSVLQCVIVCCNMS